MGIDYGLERTGLAITDPGARIAFPLATLCLRKFGSRGALLDAIADTANSKSACAVVIGLPLLPDGSESMTTRQVRNVCARLKRRIALPFYYMPELLSTAEAEMDLRDCGIGGMRARAVLDQQAACRILQSFVELAEKNRIPA